jgi:endonuclease YncB( thermonuclease family)
MPADKHKRPPASRFDLAEFGPALLCFLRTGWSGPVAVTRAAHDGDTVYVTPHGGILEWPIRLIDCWAPELSEAGGIEARDHCRKLLAAAAGKLWLFIPPPRHQKWPLADLSFERVPGYVWLNETTTLNEAMIAAGHATATRPTPSKR